MQSSLLSSYRKARLGSEQLHVPYVVLQQEEAAPKSLYRLEKSGEQGEQLTSKQEGQLAFQAGKWACFKGECQELSHHRDGGSLTPEDQLETEGSLVEPAQFLLAARLDESGNAECLALPSS